MGGCGAPVRQFLGTGQNNTIQTSGTAIDTSIRVYEDPLTCVAGDDDSGVGTNARVTIPTVLGRTYNVLVQAEAPAVLNARTR